MCCGFLNKAEQLSLEDDLNSCRLSIIAAYHGVEAFLYAVLNHPNINKKIFKDVNETIGMKSALIKFQDYLQEKRIIKQNEVLAYRNSLDNLLYYRHQVIHKCIEISQLTCKPVIRESLKFVSKYSIEIFGYDILKK